MRLNHLNLTVTDVRAASTFLETYFGLQRQGGNAGMAFLTDGAGFGLTLMKGKKDGMSYPDTFHIGFFIDSRETVDATYRRLKDDDYEPTEPSEQHAYTFYVPAPGGFTVELGA